MKKEEKFSKSEVAELKHHSRRLSIKEGIFWSARVSFGDHFITPFAIAINTSNPVVALINTLWNLSSATQIFGAKLSDRFERRKIISNSVLINALGFLLLAGIGFLYLQNIWSQYLPILLFIDLFILVFAMGIGHPAWFSLMGDLVDSKYRGRWFAKRTTILTFTTIVLTILASLILECFKNSQKEILGFIIFFLIAFLARAVGVKLLRRHYEPKRKIRKEKKVKLRDLIRESKGTNLRKFTLFRGFLAMAMGITTPLIAIYLLRNLELNYFFYILISLSGMIFSIISLNLWGKVADKYGNYVVMVLSSILIPLTPLLWILSSSKIYLFIIPGLIGGTAWYTFLMVSKNFIYDNSLKEKRATTVSYINFIIGMGAIVGGLISATLIKYVSTSWIEPIVFIFILGTLARIIPVAIFIPKIKEAKHKQKFRGLKELEHIIIKEAKPTLIEDANEIISIKNYLKE